MKKAKVAKTIERYLRKNELDTDVRIYFSGKCWDFDSSGRKTIIEEHLENKTQKTKHRRVPFLLCVFTNCFI